MPLYQLKKQGKLVAEAELIAARRWAAPAKVDEWSGKVATAEEVAAPKGSILVDTMSYYNPETDKFDAETPPTINVGQKIGVAVYYKNTGTATQEMWCKAYTIDPDGTEKEVTDAYAPNPDDKDTVDPDKTGMIAGYPEKLPAADKAGDWKMRIELYATIA